MKNDFHKKESRRHLVSTRDLELDEIHSLFERARWIRGLSKIEIGELRRNALIGIMFYQNSTRTRLSFEAAIRRIGGTSVGFSDPSITRAGDFFRESTVDTAKVIGSYACCIVIRHPQTGIAETISHVSRVPIINGGDGSNEHPTQALLDLWMMEEAIGPLEGRIIGLVGDPSCRDFRSLFFLLARTRVGKILILAPDGAAIPDDVEDDLSKAQVKVEFCEDIRELLARADTIDMLPFVLPDFSKSRVLPSDSILDIEDRFKLSREKLLRVSNRNLHIFHVGPRGPEMPPEVDECPAIKYFPQVEAGVFMRSAILHDLTNTDWY